MKSLVLVIFAASVSSSRFTMIVEDVIVLALVVDLVMFFVDVVGVGSGVLAK